jgi:hypothetical protein
MGMAQGRWLLVPLLICTAACTGGSRSPQAQSGSASDTAFASRLTNAQSMCAAKFKDVRGFKDSRAGDLRFFGPQPLRRAGAHFAGLPDDALVTLCLVPKETSFTVYGVSADLRAEVLWVQGDGRAFTPPT